MSKLAWGIIGTGNIAKTFAEAMALTEKGSALAVGSRSQESADAFADRYGIERRYPTYEALIADPEVEAVYISTPHSLHAEWAIRCAEAGKHILCEKPLTLSHKDSLPVIEAARKHDVFLMEAFMYRCHPQTIRLVELIREGKIGKVWLIQASFGFAGDFEPGHRLFDKEYGGGAILDVGCYPISMARLIAGAANGTDFENPLSLQGTGRIGAETGVDEVAVANLEFPGDVFAQASTSVRAELENNVQIFGTEGMLAIPSPWFCGIDIGGAKILFRREATDDPEVIEVENPPHLYVPEIDAVATYASDRQAPSPRMTWEDTLGNMKTLDRWLEQVGMVY